MLMTSQRSWWRQWSCRKASKVMNTSFLRLPEVYIIKWYSLIDWILNAVPTYLINMFPGVGPGCTDKTLLSAIASALHTSAAPITGQLSAAVEKNPGVWLNTTQPLCKAFIVTDEDIRWASLTVLTLLTLKTPAGLKSLFSFNFSTSSCDCVVSTDVLDFISQRHESPHGAKNRIQRFWFGSLIAAKRPQEPDQ